MPQIHQCSMNSHDISTFQERWMDPRLEGASRCKRPHGSHISGRTGMNFPVALSRRCGAITERVDDEPYGMAANGFAGSPGETGGLPGGDVPVGAADGQPRVHGLQRMCCRGRVGWCQRALRGAGIPPAGVSRSSQTGLDRAMTRPVLSRTSIRTNRGELVSTGRSTKPRAHADVGMSVKVVPGSGRAVPARSTVPRTTRTTPSAGSPVRMARTVRVAGGRRRDGAHGGGSVDEEVDDAGEARGVTEVDPSGGQAGEQVAQVTAGCVRPGDEVGILAEPVLSGVVVADPGAGEEYRVAGADVPEL